MPFTIKATTMFAVRKHGWSESFFWQQATNDLDAALQRLEFLAGKRAPLLGAEASVEGIRVSIETDDLGNPVLGDSNPKRLFLAGNIAHPADEPDAALMLRWTNAPATKHRNSFLRGIWDDVDANGGLFDGSVDGYQTKLNSYLTQLLAVPTCGWLTTNQIGPVHQVTSYNSDDQGRITFICENNAFAGMIGKTLSVRVSRVNQPVKSRANGLHVVTVETANTVRTVRALAVFPFVNPGTLRVLSSSFIPAARIKEQGIVTKRVGAPLLQSRGHARAKPRG